MRGRCGLPREPLLAGPTLTPDLLDRLTAQVCDHLSAGETITGRPLLWQACGTRP